MGIQKMNLANIKGKLSRAEMKNIMAGGEDDGFSCRCNNDKSAGMASCDTCEKWCKTQGSTEKACD